MDDIQEQAVELLKRVLKEVISKPYGGTYHALPNGPLRNDIRDFLEMLARKEARNSRHLENFDDLR